MLIYFFLYKLPLFLFKYIIFFKEKLNKTEPLITYFYLYIIESKSI